MGVVKRQSFKTSLVRYALLPLGFIASIFIYPYSGETNDAYGYFNYVISIATLLSPLILFGIPSICIRFFPQFKNEENGHNGFLSFLSLSVLAALGISSIVLYLLSDLIFGMSITTEDYVIQNRSIIIPLAITTGLISFFTYYISNFNRIVIPNLLESLRSRIFIPLLVLSLGFGYFSFQSYTWIILICFLVHLGILLF